MGKFINIAIDGPAGAGKSTIAKQVAKMLGILYLDTGAMYRVVALKAIREGIDTLDWDKVAYISENIDIDIVYDESGAQKVILNGEDVSNLIRTPEVSKGSSDVSAVPSVRIKLVELQRKIAEKNSVIMDGRDIGTYVLPNANIKIFLTASVDERAERRFKEMYEKDNKHTFCDVKKDIEYRDKNDSSREFAPLSVAADAILIDTTEMTIDEVMKKIIKIIEDN